MNDVYQHSLSIIEKMANNGGKHLKEQDCLFLKSSDKDVIDAYEDRIGSLYDAIFKGFFNYAKDGELLFSESKITELYGKPLEDNYPEASDAFLKFAKTYWTLKVLVLEIANTNLEYAGRVMLERLERDIGSVFFPTPGPNQIKPAKREKFQRELLMEYAPDVNIGEFMQGNPILIRDRKSSSGCIATMIIIAVIIMAIIVLIFL